MKEAVLIDACRTPIGRAGDRGVFRAIAHPDLMIPVLQTLVKRNHLDPALIDDIVLGSVGLGGIRQILLAAGFPQSVAGVDTNRQCASSLQATAVAAHWIMNDDADIMLSVGMETMGRVGPVPPTAIGRRGAGGPRPVRAAPQEEVQYPPDWKKAKLTPGRDLSIPLMGMGNTAEELSRRYNISREDSDAFALTSQQKAIAAQDAGYFKDEIIPITINYEDGTSEVVSQDQCPRRGTSLEKLAALPPAFEPNGRVTAGNSCPENDGASACLLMSKDMAKKMGYKPLMTFRHAVVIGVDPTVMGIGPYPSTAKLLKRTGMSIKDIDMIEINEAFACQVVYSGRMLGFTPADWAKTNVKGGAVAIGHPFGVTGCRLVGVLGHEMKRRNLRWGIATLCIGGGMGMATLWEREPYYEI
jgi:acetyl-CoA acetyltransferase family protein